MIRSEHFIVDTTKESSKLCSVSTLLFCNSDVEYVAKIRTKCPFQTVSEGDNSISNQASQLWREGFCVNSQLKTYLR